MPKLTKNAALKKLFLQCFDEGADSPYEMREEIVANLMANMKAEGPANSLDMGDVSFGEAVDQELSVSLANYCKQLMPKPIRQILNAGQFFLSGGAIVKLLCDPANATSSWNQSDWDIYCTLDAYNLGFAHKSAMGIGASGEYGEDHQLKGSIDSLPINILISKKYTSAEEIVKHFDLTIVKGVYWEKATEPFFHMPVRSWFDLSMNQLHLAWSNMKPKDKTIDRIRKYVKRGFRDCTGLVEKGTLSERLMLCHKQITDQVNAKNASLKYSLNALPKKRKKVHV